MPKIKDSMVVGLLGGLIGALSMDLSNFILWRNNKTEGLYGHLAGSMIMRPGKLKQGKNFIVGEILHVTVGSVIGLILTAVFRVFGKDHYFIKGGFLATVTWGFLYNFGQKMNFYRLKPHLTKSSYASILHHLIYGLVTSKVIVFFADPNMFSSKKSNEVSYEQEVNPNLSIVE
ncbi:hypothetical protein [Desulfosporosinus acidiphilus]|nr:hypothetical protein [Desulfosporosinus acidiphilus]